MSEKKDTHAYVLYESNKTYKNLDIDGNGFSEAGKASNLENVIIENCIFSGGSEDNFDIVRGENYTFKNCTFKNPNLQNLTIKGGARGIKFINCKFMGKPKKSHIVFGQYSDYDLCGIGKTENIEIINCLTDQNRITVELWNARKIKVVNSNVRVKNISKFVVWWYFKLRKAQQFLKYGKSGRGNACERI